VLQIAEVKLFKPEDNKKNIKSKLKLSDGHSSCIGMVVDKHGQSGNDVTTFSIIRINAGMLSANAVQDRYIIVIKGPFEVIYTGLKRLIGSPQEYSSNLARNDFALEDLNLSIPVQETDQKRVYRINPDDGDINEELNNMSIRSPMI